MYAFVIVMKVSSNSNFETRVIHFSCFEICVLFQSQSKYFLFIQSRLKVHFFSLIDLLYWSDLGIFLILYLILKNTKYKDYIKY
jgi:hypothetical protein